jgi:phage antirepressor YoqD-like protein
MTPTQEAYIRSNSQRQTIGELARNMKVTEEDIAAWMKQLNISQRRRGPSTPKRDPDTVKEGYFSHSKDLF